MTEAGSDPPLPPPPGGYAPLRGASRESVQLPESWSGTRQRLQPDPDGTEPPRPPGGEVAPVGAGFGRNDIFAGLGLSTVAFLFIFLLGFGIFAVVDDDPSENADFVAVAIIVFVVDLIALIVVPFALLRGRGAAALLGLRRPTWRALGWGVGALIASWISLAAYQAIVDAIGVEALQPVSAIDGEGAFTVAAAVLTGIAVVLMAPMAEEIFHRGFLVGAIARRWGAIVGVVVSAAIFSALHFDVGSLIPFFIVGVVFAVAYLRSRNLWASITAHFLFNVVAFAVTVSDRGVG